MALAGQIELAPGNVVHPEKPSADKDAILKHIKARYDAGEVHPAWTDVDHPDIPANETPLSADEQRERSRRFTDRVAQMVERYKRSQGHE
jgi:hypothetical protein